MNADFLPKKLSCNMVPVDRSIRVMAGILMVTFAFLNSYWFFLPATIILYTGLSGHCFMYQLTGINKSLGVQNFYLSYLPKNNPEPVFVFNSKGSINFQNDASMKILPSIQEFKNAFSQSNITEIIQEKQNISIRYREGRETYQLEARGVPDIQSILVFGFNITEIIENEKTLKKLSTTDPLTKLHNRNKLISDITKFQQNQFALILMDIKNFGQMNIYYGFNQGDEYLKNFSCHLTEFAKSTSGVFNIYRMHSDVFAMILIVDSLDIQSNGNQFSVKVMDTVNTLKSSLDQHSIQMGDIELSISLRFGIAGNQHCQDNIKASELLSQADTALMEAKNRNTEIISYCEIIDIVKQYESNIQWSNILKNTLEGKNNMTIIPFFQPILDLQTGEICKYECLVRMLDKDDIISPAKFLPPAKQLGLLPDITEIVIKKGFQKFSGTDYQFSINISKQDLIKGDLTKLLLKESLNHRIKPEQVILELLEDDNIYQYTDAINRIKNAGFKIAIDDFGTGYSNFSKHKDLDVDFLKIDGSLIKSIGEKPEDATALIPIIEYAKAIGAQTIAEFVSDKAILDKVKELGIDYGQGFYIGKPEPKIIGLKR